MYRTECTVLQDSSHRRIKWIILLTIVFFVFNHLFRTGRFLLHHFFGDETQQNLLALDLISWQENPQWNEQIPRHIHQIWIASNPETVLPTKYARAGQLCRKLHLNYTYTLWTHGMISEWLEKYYPWFRPIYFGYSYDMQRVDAMKYLLLFHYGGIYIDLDVQCRVEDILQRMLAEYHTKHEPDIILHMGTEGISANTDVMASKRLHPCMKLAISQLKSADRWFYLYHLTIILSAGPTYFHGIYRQCPWKERIYHVPNDLLWGQLVEGVGGATWYGRDTLFIIFLIKNRMLCISLFIVFSLCGTCLWKKPHCFRRIYRRIKM